MHGIYVSGFATKEPGQQKPKAKAKGSDGAERSRETVDDDGLGAPPAEGLGEPGPEAGKEEVEPAPKPEAPKKVSGKASGSNFAGRSPPNSPPYSTRFLCCKKTWTEILGIIVQSLSFGNTISTVALLIVMSSSGRFIRRSSPGTIRSPRLRSFREGLPAFFA